MVENFGYDVIRRVLHMHIFIYVDSLVLFIDLVKPVIEISPGIDLELFFGKFAIQVLFAGQNLSFFFQKPMVIFEDQKCVCRVGLTFVKQEFYPVVI